MEKDSFTIFYITHETKESARNFINHCLSEKWIACGNVFAIDSSYFWKEKVISEDEYVSIVKTGNHLIDSFMNFAEKTHPYETPCLLHWKVKANPAYTKWIYDSVKAID